MSYTRCLYLAAALTFFMITAVHAHSLVKSEGRIRMQHVTPQHVQNAVLDYVRSQKEETVADVQVRLLEPEQPLSLPGAAVDIRVLPIPSAERYGRREFDVALSTNGKVIHTARASADIIALVDVAVATRLIKIDQTIEVDDVAIARTPMTTAPQQYAMNLDEVIGKRAVRPIAPHVPIHVSTLAQPYLVRKGDRVTIEAKRGGLQIQTIGIMKVVGKVGQTVTVTNQDSGKDLRAKVIGPGLVRVDF
ncbi:flagellar basal body P-ring formation chaperone FlgA [Nitrospira sp. Nam74]